MATFNAEIGLEIQSSGVEKAVRRIEKRFDSVQDASNKILNLDRTILATRKQLLTAQDKSARKARERLSILRLQRQELVLQKRAIQATQQAEPSGGSGGGGGGGGADGGAAAFLAAGGLEGPLAALRKFTASFNSDVEQAVESLKETDRYVARIADNSKKLGDQTEKVNETTKKIAENNRTIEEAERKKTAATREANRINSQLEKGLIKQAEKVKEAKINQAQAAADASTYADQIKTANRSNGQLNRLLKERRAVLDDINARYDSINKKVEKQAKSLVGRNRQYASALAGAAFASVPGQDLFQAAGAGALVGGLPGAGIAAFTASVLKAGNALAAFGRQSAITASELSKLEIGLKTVLGPDAQQGFQAITRIVEDFNQPLEDATRQFTQLSAAARANGSSVAEIEKLYRSLSSAVKATGGTTEDLSGVLRAATQVISKGVVQSEELRGQIGDRLPGAFTLFARATKRSEVALTKALQKGEVSAEEFVTKFAQYLENRFAPAAELIGDLPAEAGARLEASLTRAQASVGRLLGGIGAAFQDTFSKILDLVTRASDALARFFGIGLDNAIAKTIRDIERIQGLIDGGATTQGGLTGTRNRRFKKQLAALEERLAELKRQQKIIDDATGDGLAPTSRATVIDELPSVQDSLDRAAALRREAELLGNLLKLEQARGALTSDQAAAREQAIRLAARLKEIDATIEDPVERAAARGEAIARNALALARIETAAVERSKERTALFEAQVQDLRDQTALAAVLTTKDREKLELEQQIARFRRENVNLSQEQLRQYEDQARALFAQKDATAQLVAEQQRIEDLVNRTGAAFTTLFENLISQTSDLNAVLADTIRQLSSILLRAGFNALGGNDGRGFFSALSGNIGTRAMGGPVTAGQPYVVGERRPEVFIPRTSGYIQPGVGVGGSDKPVVVNIYNSDDGVRGESDGAQLGRLVESAVTATIQREKRPGGLLS